jgi:hypothetical protein
MYKSKYTVYVFFVNFVVKNAYANELYNLIMFLFLVIVYLEKIISLILFLIKKYIKKIAFDKIL